METILQQRMKFSNGNYFYSTRKRQRKSPCKLMESIKPFRTNSIRLDIPESILNKAYHGDIQALFQISFYACEENRLGLAKEFLRLAYQELQKKVD